MSQPFKLYRLQQIDSQLDWTRGRLREIETALNEGEALRQAMQQAEETEKALQEARRATRQAEDNVQQQRLKIEQNEATLYGGKVSNPKELQDIQNEVAALKRFLGSLEDRQLEAMLAEEEAEAKNALTAVELDKTRKQFEQQHQDLIEEQVKLLKDVRRFEEERAAAASAVAPEDMLLYNQLRQQRRGIAVAKVVNRACSACGSTLSAILLHAAHSPTQLTRCESCGRVLYIG